MYKYGKNIVSSIHSRITNSITHISSSSTSLSTTNVSSIGDEGKNQETNGTKQRPADSKVNSFTSSSLSSSANCNHHQNEIENNITITNDNDESKINLHSNHNTTTSTATIRTSTPIPIKSNHGKKRNRRFDGYKTPVLVHPQSSECDSSSSCTNNDDVELSHPNQLHPNKKQKIAGVMGQTSTSLLLDMIPQEVLETHIFSFLTDANDFHSLQLTCSSVKNMSNKQNLLRNLDLNGNPETGEGSILMDVDSPVVAVERLYKFASAGNQQALYMYVYS